MPREWTDRRESVAGRGRRLDWRKFTDHDFGIILLVVAALFSLGGLHWHQVLFIPAAVIAAPALLLYLSGDGSDES